MRKAVPDAEALEAIIAVIANILSVSRIVFSLFLFAVSPSSPRFALLYLLCGVTDVLDGFTARALHTESRAGESLDSLADLFFAAVYAVKLLPLLCIPPVIWLWTALIAAAKLWGILQRSKMERRFTIAHSFANKLTGLLLFLLPPSIRLIDIRYGAALVCAAATFAAAEELCVNGQEA